jgi:superfamily II DNA or RNA helicase
LLEAVRKAALPGVWSQGVSLAREGAVLVSTQRADEITLRVRAAGRPVAPTVVLYPESEEWACDCGGKIDPCAHVTAAVIALNQTPARPSATEPAEAPDLDPGTGGAAHAQRGAASAAASQGSGASKGQAKRPALRLAYRLGRANGSMTFERVLIDESGRERRLEQSLASMIARGTAGELVPTHDDLTIDRITSGWPRGHFSITRAAEVFTALAGADVTFEGGDVVLNPESIGPRAVVVDEGRGVAIRIEADARIDEVVARGIVRIGKALHPLAETQLTGDRLERLPIVKTFAREQLGELVTKALPELRRTLHVEVRTKRLPKSGRGARPRIQMELGQKEHTLSVVPLLVYGDPPVARIDGGRLVHLRGAVPVRDEAAERVLVQRLRDELSLVPGRRVDYDGPEAVRFVAKLRAFRAGETKQAERGEAGAKLFGDGLFAERPLVPRFVVDGDAFDVVFELETDPNGPAAADVDDDEFEGGSLPKRATAEAVLRSFRDGLDVVPLEGGGFAPLPHGFLERYGDRISDLLAARTEKGTIARASIPALAELCDELGAPRPPGMDKLAPLVEGFNGLPAASIPNGLEGTLRPYQRDGVNWLAFLRDAGLGAILADDMGLGKTLQALAAVRGKTLVVCPKSVVFNWADEAKKFRPDLRAHIFHGPRRKLDPDADLTLTTYAVLRMDIDALAKAGWDAVILDEAQTIKNPDSQVARAAYAMDAPFRLCLSGTPVENRLEELWSQMHFANRGLLGGRSDFRARYEQAIANGNKDAGVRLRKRITPFVLRRTKREVAPELPPRTDAVLLCELDETERSIYDAVRAATRKDVLEKLASGGNVLAALEALLRLRQAACHPALVPGQGAVATSSSKIERLLVALEDAAADGHKALVFSQWTSLLDLVEPHLREAGIPFTRLDGKTEDRAGVVADFQAEAGPPVMLVSLKAGGTGLNLTAADHVFLLDPWWNPAVEDQAADRAHRIGQDRPVFVYRMVAKDTVEERILSLQERKRALADVALGQADTAAALTKEDLLELLRD